MKKIAALAVAAALSMLSVSAFAQDANKKPAPASKAPAPAKPKARDVIFTTGSGIEGTRPTTDQGPITGKQDSVMTNLIRLRYDFNDRIVASAEDL